MSTACSTLLNPTTAFHKRHHVQQQTFHTDRQTDRHARTRARQLAMHTRKMRASLQFLTKIIALYESETRPAEQQLQLYYTGIIILL